MEKNGKPRSTTATAIGMDQGRVLALDLGKQRIGLALSDELQVIAQGLETLERTNIREDLARLSRLAVGKQRVADRHGNPLHMSGQEGRQTSSLVNSVSGSRRPAGFPWNFGTSG